MPTISVTSFENPLLLPYQDLRGKNLTRLSERFIAESPWVVERLLASSYEVESILVSERMLERIAAVAPPSTPVFFAPENLLRELVGFPFHRGVLACARRKHPQVLSNLAADETFKQQCSGPWLALQDVVDQENIGGLIRTAGALGVNNVLLTKRCADPFSRQAIRVAMGVTFTIRLFESTHLAQDLITLKRTFAFPILAAAIGPTAAPLRTIASRQNGCLVLGGEGHGLSADVIQCCDITVQIPMADLVDSLNVNVAGGIFMHYLFEREFGTKG